MAFTPAYQPGRDGPAGGGYPDIGGAIQDALGAYRQSQQYGLQKGQLGVQQGQLGVAQKYLGDALKQHAIENARTGYTPAGTAPTSAPPAQGTDGGGYTPDLSGINFSPTDANVMSGVSGGGTNGSNPGGLGIQIHRGNLGTFTGDPNEPWVGGPSMSAGFGGGNAVSANQATQMAIGGQPQAQPMPTTASPSQGLQPKPIQMPPQAISQLQGMGQGQRAPQGQTPTQAPASGQGVALGQLANLKLSDFGIPDSIPVEGGGSINTAMSYLPQLMAARQAALLKGAEFANTDQQNDAQRLNELKIAQGNNATSTANSQRDLEGKREETKQQATALGVHEGETQKQQFEARGDVAPLIKLANSARQFQTMGDLSNADPQLVKAWLADAIPLFDPQGRMTNGLMKYATPQDQSIPGRVERTASILLNGNVPQAQRDAVMKSALGAAQMGNQAYTKKYNDEVAQVPNARQFLTSPASLFGNAGSTPAASLTPLTSGDKAQAAKDQGFAQHLQSLGYTPGKDF